MTTSNGTLHRLLDLLHTRMPSRSSWRRLNFYGHRSIRAKTTQTRPAGGQQPRTLCVTAVGRRVIMPATVRSHSQPAANSVTRMGIWKRRARGKRTGVPEWSRRVVMRGKRHSFMVVMRLLLSLQTVISIIVCKRSSQGSMNQQWVRY